VSVRTRAERHGFQAHNLFPHKTVLQNVIEGPVIVQKRPKAEAIEDARRLLEQVGLAEKADQYPYQLSGGQQQRVGIAGVRATRPGAGRAVGTAHQAVPPAHPGPDLDPAVSCCPSTSLRPAA
jgi:ABC-type histidine transport system ATPase subunit